MNRKRWIMGELYQYQANDIPPDQRQQQADEEQQLHECLDALLRIEQWWIAASFFIPESRIANERVSDLYRTFRQDLEEVARYAQVLQYLHAPLR